MARKPNSMYRRPKRTSFTRKEYTGGVPALRIIRFHVGNRQEHHNFPVHVTLEVTETCQIRHTALEAARVIANSTIRKVVGASNYSLHIRTYPHNILRENKQATGAGADRVSQGMRSAFGKNVGTAARVKAGQKIVTIACNKEGFVAAKDALRKAGMRFPSPIKIRIDKGEEQLKGLI